MPRADLGHVGGLLHRRRARQGRAHFDPGFEAGDLFLRQFFVFGRHLEVGIGVPHGLYQQTGVGIAGDDGRTGAAALEQSLGRVEPQVAFELFGLLAMALVTVLHEQRPDFGFEKLNLLGSGFSRGRVEGRTSKQESACQNCPEKAVPGSA